MINLAFMVKCIRNRKADMENGKNSYGQNPSNTDISKVAVLTSHSLGKISVEGGENLPEKSPTQNLYLAIFDELPEHDVDEADIPELIDWLLTSTGSEREGEVIVRYLGIGSLAEPYVKIADEEGVSRSAMQVIGQKAIAKLQHPHRAEIIKMMYATRAELRDKVCELEGQVSTLNNRVSNLNRELELERAKYSKLLGEVPEADYVKAAAPNLGIEYLELSPVINYNLPHGGIKTVGDLLASNKKKLREIKFINAKEVAEIEARLGQLGLSLKGDLE